MRTRLVLVVSLTVITALAAQTPQDRPTFRSGANYVRVDMYATRDGKPVNDLSAADLEVLEDGGAQKIVDFEHVVVWSACTSASCSAVIGSRCARVSILLMI